MTPSFSGRTATMFPGVRPIIRFAWTPAATILPVSVLSATTDGSFSATPRPRTYTSVLAVPRSTARSRPRNASTLPMTNGRLLTKLSADDVECGYRTIVNVALPTIGRKLHVAESDLQWVVTGYGLTFGGFLLLGGRAADLLGRRRV